MLLTLVLSLLILITGILFLKFNNHLWNNPLLLISKNRSYVNKLAGKSLIISSFLYFFISMYLIGTMFYRVSLYLICMLLNFVVLSLILIIKKRI